MNHQFDHLLRVFQSERFLKMQGLGNEVPFFIYAFDPEQRNDVMKMVDNLKTRLSAKGIAVLKVDLYDITLDLLESRGLLDRLLMQEQELQNSELLETLRNVCDAENYVIPAIAKKCADDPPDILFITGVGEVYPYLRSHTILNNLQKEAKAFPTVMFYPGEYAHSSDGGSSLVLFSRLHNDKYYRAFDLSHFEI